MSTKVVETTQVSDADPIDELNFDIEEIEKKLQELRHTVQRLARRLAESGIRRTA